MRRAFKYLLWYTHAVRYSVAIVHESGVCRQWLRAWLHQVARVPWRVQHRLCHDRREHESSGARVARLPHDQALAARSQRRVPGDAVAAGPEVQLPLRDDRV